MGIKLPFIPSFKPGREGIQQVLGELESDVMESLWSKNHGLTGREIYEGIKQKKKIAYTTILTVIDRLVNKGLIHKTKSPDRTYQYFPAITKDKFKEEVSMAVMRGLLEFAEKGTVAAFINTLESSNPEILEELEKLLKEKLKEKGEGNKIDKLVRSA